MNWPVMMIIKTSPSFIVTGVVGVHVIVDPSCAHPDPVISLAFSVTVQPLSRNEASIVSLILWTISAAPVLF
jgi:hypothetical protein